MMRIPELLRPKQIGHLQENRRLKSTFTKWWNARLGEKKLKVGEISKDLGSGILLHELLEILSGEQLLPKPHPHAKLNSHRLANIQTCLNFLKCEGIDVGNIDCDIVSGVEEMILELTWKLILHFEVKPTCKDLDGLLSWCQALTGDQPNFTITDFSSSFKDGAALVTLISKGCPGLLGPQGEHQGSVAEALSLAEQHLAVPMLLEASDLTGCPEERCIITYLVFLKQALDRKALDKKTPTPKEQHERNGLDLERIDSASCDQILLKSESSLSQSFTSLSSGRRTSSSTSLASPREDTRKKPEERVPRPSLLPDPIPTKVPLTPPPLDFPQQPQLAKLQAWQSSEIATNDYQARSIALVTKIALAHKEVQSALNTIGNTMPEVQDRLDHLNDPLNEILAEKLELEALSNLISTRLKVERKPPPTFEYPMPQINTYWRNFLAAHQAFKKALLERKSILERLTLTLERFKRVVVQLDSWYREHSEMIHQKNLGSNVAETTSFLFDHERFIRKAKAQDKAYKQFLNLSKLLPPLPAAIEVTNKIKNLYDPLPVLCKDRMDALQAELQKQKHLEVQRLKFTEDLCDFEAFLLTGEEVVRYPIPWDNESELNELLDSLKKMASAIKLPDCPSPGEKAQAEEAMKRYEVLTQALGPRKAEIRNQDLKKKQNEELYQRYAKAISLFDGWFLRMSILLSEDAITEIFRQKAMAVESNLGEGQTHLSNLVELHASLASAGLQELANPHASFTLEMLKREFGALKGWAETRREMLPPPRSRSRPETFTETSPLPPPPLPPPLTAPGTTLSQGASPSLPPAPSPPGLSPSSSTSSFSSASSSSTSASSRRIGLSSNQPVAPPKVMPKPPKAVAAPPLLPKFDDTKRKKKELEPNLCLYITQTTSSPLAIRYEVECSRYEITEFSLSLEESTNIMIVQPSTAIGLVCTTEVPPFQIFTVAIALQSDPRKTASLRTKYSWVNRSCDS